MMNNTQETPNATSSSPHGSRAFSTLIWFVILWSGMLAFWLYLYSVRHGGVPCWDGFERCAWASHIWYDLRHFDLYHFWRHTNAQVVWPFLHSWMTGFAFVLFGPSLATARILCLIAYWGSGVLMLLWFMRRRDPFAYAGGVLAWCLYSTAPIVIQQSIGIMSEGIGLFLALIILLSLPREESGLRRWAWSGLLLGIYFFYKYNFAFLTYTGLLLYRFAAGGYTLRGLFSKKNFLLFGIPVFLMILWFIPDFKVKKQNLIYFAVNNPAAHRAWGVKEILYYPQVIPASYFAHPAFAVAFAALVLIMLPVSLRLTFRNPALAIFFVHFFAAVFHPMKMERFQFIAMGMFFILAGEALQTVLSVYLTRPKWIFPVIGVFILAMLVPCISYQSTLYRTEQVDQQDVYRAPIQAMVDRLDSSSRAAMFITHDNASPPAATFYLITGLDILQRDLRANISHWHHLFLFAPLDEVQSLSLEEKIKRLRYELFINRTNEIVTLENTTPWESPIFPTVFAGEQEYIKLIPELPEYQLTFEREFPLAKARLRIYRLK